MANVFTTGPCAVYVGTRYTPGIPSPSFLGWFVEAPEIDVEPRYTPVPSDVAGGLPHDRIYNGKNGRCFGSLSAINWSVVLAVTSRPLAVMPQAPGVAPLGWGTDPPGARGSLVHLEGFSYNLWTIFPNGIKAAYGGFMPLGFRWPYSFVFGPDRYLLGTRPNSIPIAFQMDSVLQADGSWLLADQNLVGIPATPPPLTF